MGNTRSKKGQSSWQMPRKRTPEKSTHGLSRRKQQLLESIRPKRRQPSGAGSQKRRKIEEEFVNSEKVYIRGLQQILIDYVDPLEHAGILPENSELRVLLGPVEILIILHTDLYERMCASEYCAGVFTEETIGWMKTYSRIINEYDSIVHQIKVMRNQNPQIDEFFAEREKDIEFYLLYIIQRVPRYNLLLKELLKNTPEDHENYECVVEAKRQIQEVCDQLNDEQKKHEDKVQFTEISDRLKESRVSIWAPARKLVGQYDCLVPKGKTFLGKTSLKRGKLIIFSDKFLIIDAEDDVVHTASFANVDDIHVFQEKNRCAVKITSHLGDEDSTIILYAKDSKDQSMFVTLMTTQKESNSQALFVESALCSENDNDEVSLYSRTLSKTVSHARMAKAFEDMGVRTPPHILPGGISFASMDESLGGSTYVESVEEIGPMQYSAFFSDTDPDSNATPQLTVEFWDRERKVNSSAL